MKLKPVVFFISAAIILLPLMITAQSQYLTEKQGSYSFYNNTRSEGTENIAFGNHVKTISDYFYQNIPMMKASKGFDLAVTLFGYWDDEYKKRSSNYGLRGELRFDFQLFLNSNGKEDKWTVEPPHWYLEINNTETGHGGMQKEGNEASLLKELFLVFPLIREIVPGVHYYDCEPRTCGSLVVFNPDRPAYWLPVTVRDVVEAKLKFYKADDSNKMLYDFIKPLVDNMSQDELNSPAHYGSDDGILNVNGKRDGLQMMRFNPDYWDRTLPPSAIQFMTIGYTEYGFGNKNKTEQENADNEFRNNNGHPDYSQVVRNSMLIKDLPRLLTKTNK